MTHAQVYALLRAGSLEGIRVGGRNQWRVNASGSKPGSTAPTPTPPPTCAPIRPARSIRPSTRTVMAAECGPVRLPPPVMLARPTRVLPDRPGLAYEPKLDLYARFGSDG